MAPEQVRRQGSEVVAGGGSSIGNALGRQIEEAKTQIDDLRGEGTAEGANERRTRWAER